MTTRAESGNGAQSRLDAIAGRVFLGGFAAMIASLIIAAILQSYGMPWLSVLLIMMTCLLWIGINAGVAIAQRAIDRPDG